MWNCVTVGTKMHEATVGERLTARTIHTGGAALFGDKREVACINHEGARLEISSIPARIGSYAFSEESKRAILQLLPGQVIDYTPRGKQDIFRLSDGTEVHLYELAGTTFTLFVPVTVPVEGIRSTPDTEHAFELFGAGMYDTP